MGRHVKTSDPVHWISPPSGGPFCLGGGHEISLPPLGIFDPPHEGEGFWAWGVELGVLGGNLESQGWGEW